MADIPIIFSKAMILALLTKRKTMTRRLLYSERKAKTGLTPSSAKIIPAYPPQRVGRWPNTTPAHYWTVSGWERVKIGDRLYVKERLCSHGHFGFPLSFGPQIRDGDNARVWSYFADGIVTPEATGGRPSIHCPRSFSRITLVVFATKIERLQSISYDDAVTEGVGIFPNSMSAQKRFRELWCSLHGDESWAANPDVVCLSFAVHQKNIDEMKEAA
jgi:hypothetical protein